MRTILCVRIISTVHGINEERRSENHQMSFFRVYSKLTHNYELFILNPLLHLLTDNNFRSKHLRILGYEQKLKLNIIGTIEKT